MPNNWIFQANPASYAIEQSLSMENAEYWNLRQHANDVSSGDRVFIWLSGEDAGVYAVGTVVSESQVREDSHRGKQYWKLEREKHRARARVLVRYDTVLASKPLFKDVLQWDPVLGEMAIMRNPRGTNFRLTMAEAQRLDEWVRRATD